MGFKELTLQLPTEFNEDLVRKRVGQALQIKEFTFHLESKSLDARKNKNIHWLVKVVVSSPELKGPAPESGPILEIPQKSRTQKAIVVGSGPAGFFSALVLQKAGFKTTLIERGSDVDTRGKAIFQFEKTGEFQPQNNYAFGEGGAGTFSDGKLTSRSKHISAERDFIISTYIEAGAPEEIAYMAHPHLGTDNLRKMAKKMRELFTSLGGEIKFDTQLTDIEISNNIITGIKTNKGDIQADVCFLAIGHSAYETYRMLLKRGVPFRTKNFAIGSRMEHRQETINRAQWGVSNLPGVKAAEYRLTSPADGKHQVYSFCMCPGGIVVPATAYANSNIVNGMSFYARNGAFANAACVAGLHPDEMAGKEVSAVDALYLVEDLERSFYNFTGSYVAPACSIKDFMAHTEHQKSLKTSYPLGVVPAPLWNLLPPYVVKSMVQGLEDFNRKIKNFDQGILVGLESKTSSPIQVLRDRSGLVEGFENLYMIGEGSGYAGGIVSSGADGVKAAMHFVVS